jgi:hypothetical protein
MTELCPPPGIYPGIDFEVYRSWQAVNHSKLVRIDKSPLHTQVMPDLSEKKAIRLGQLVHSGTLEPGSVAQRYAVMPAFENDPENQTAQGKPSTSSATEYVKSKRAAFYRFAEASGRIVIDQDEYDQYLKLADAINENENVRGMIAAGECELSIVWQDKETKIMCKARIDCKTPSRLMDLKTSRDDGDRPLPESFEWSLWSYSYYSQAAWYQSGWHALTGERLPFWFAVVATSEPYQCVAAPVGEMSLQMGREKNRQRLAAYAECHRAGRFPGYESPVLFELPEKYFRDDLNGGAT